MFVDKAELHESNKEPERMKCSAEPESVQGHIIKVASRRDIPDLSMSWLHCFNSCLALVYFT